ncbi:hypothetical protein Trydic_g19360 [Trypoxylus dichotomus]
MEPRTKLTVLARWCRPANRSLEIPGIDGSYLVPFGRINSQDTAYLPERLVNNRMYSDSLIDGDRIETIAHLH